MSEGEGFPKQEEVQGEKGGERVHSGGFTGEFLGSDIDSPHGRIDEALRSGELPRKQTKTERPVNVRKAERAALRRIATEHLARMRATPEPGPQPSRIPYSTERMNFGPNVRQRGKR